MLKALLELALVPVPIDPDMHSVAMGDPALPLADVGVALGAPPLAGPVLEPVAPLAQVVLAIGPGVLAHALGLAVQVVALVQAPVAKYFVALPVLVVILPASLVGCAIEVQHDALSVSVLV